MKTVQGPLPFAYHSEFSYKDLKAFPALGILLDWLSLQHNDAVAASVPPSAPIITYGDFV